MLLFSSICLEFAATTIKRNDERGFDLEISLGDNKHEWKKGLFDGRWRGRLAREFRYFGGTLLHEKDDGFRKEENTGWCGYGERVRDLLCATSSGGIGG